MIVVERIGPRDREALEALLRANHLPLDGLDLALPLSVVARDGDELIGCAAVQRYGSAGLLRSVCVEERHRSTGVGQALVDAVEGLAAGGGISELFLLTETAAGWFPRLGYEAAVRADAPAEMAASPEFVSACPVSASVLRKRLTPAAAAARG